MFDYVEYPSQILVEEYMKKTVVKSATDCAYACSSEKEFKCKSFNLCNKDASSQFNCLLSSSHNNYTADKTNMVFSAVCKHFSSILFFIFLVKLQLNVKLRFLST